MRNSWYSVWLKWKNRSGPFLPFICFRFFSRVPGISSVLFHFNSNGYGSRNGIEIFEKVFSARQQYTSDYYPALKREIAEFHLTAQFHPLSTFSRVFSYYCMRLFSFGTLFASLQALRLESMVFFYDFCTRSFAVRCCFCCCCSFNAQHYVYLETIMLEFASNQGKQCLSRCKLSLEHSTYNRFIQRLENPMNSKHDNITASHPNRLSNIYVFTLYSFEIHSFFSCAILEMPL